MLTVALQSTSSVTVGAVSVGALEGWQILRDVEAACLALNQIHGSQGEQGLRRRNLLLVPQVVWPPHLHCTWGHSPTDVHIGEAPQPLSLYRVG